jgi:hypothetical protein
MDNFFRNKDARVNPITLQCSPVSFMIFYKPLTTGGNTPNNVKTQLYSQYVRSFTK